MVPRLEFKYCPSYTVAGTAGSPHTQASTDTIHLQEIALYVPNTTTDTMKTRVRMNIFWSSFSLYMYRPTQSLGQLGHLVKIEERGYAVVKVNGRRWLFDSSCLVPAPGEELEDEIGERYCTSVCAHI